MYNKLFYKLKNNNVFFRSIVVLIFNITSCTLYSQESGKELKEMMWNRKDPDFAIKSPGSRWLNESAVILCKSYDYRVKKDLMFSGTDEIINIHQRILLLDQAAVNDFSTLKFDYNNEFGYFFRYNTNTVYLGVKIIKPDGTEKEVDISNVAENIYENDYTKQKEKKIAVPNLKIGDIIDYYYCTEKNIQYGKVYSFGTVIYPLVEKYPVLKNKVTLHIMRRCFLSARSMNGAPELNLVEDNKRSDMIYTLIDTCRDKKKDQIYIYQLREYPILLFQAYTNAASTLKNRVCFYDRENVIKKSVSNDELLQFVNYNFSTSAGWKTGKIYRNVKRICKNTNDPNKKIHETYNFLRQLYFFKDYDMVTSPLNFRYQLNEYTFANTMLNVFRRFGISSSVVLTVPREIGAFDDLIVPGQMGILIKINGDNPYYISNFTSFSLVNELDASFQGNKGKTVNMAFEYESRDISDATLPQMNYQDNKEFRKCILDFNVLNPDTLSISSNVTLKGLSKISYQAVYITPNDYIAACKNKYGQQVRKNSDYIQSVRIEQANKRAIEERTKMIKKYIEYEYDLYNEVVLTKFELIQPGIWEDAPELVYNQNFKTTRFINKAGENFIIEAGMMIGMQIFNQTEDSIRKYNIYMPYPRLYEENIIINIPEGFLVKGIEKFNFDIQNQTGGFISFACIEGRTAIIKTKKYFVNNFEKIEKWPDLLKFIDAANDFRNQKILLVKINSAPK